MPRLERDDALAHGVDHLAVVRRHEDGGARAVDALEQLHDAQRDRRVEVTRGLVAHKQRWAVHHGAGHGDALLLTTRELVGVDVHLLAQAHEAQHLGHLRLDDRARLADALEGKGHVVKDGLVRQQLEVLEHAADLAAQVRDLPVAHGAQVLASDHDLAVRGLELAGDELEERRLTRAGMAHEEHKLAGKDVNVHVVERRLVGLRRIDHRDALERDDGRAAVVDAARVGIGLLGDGRKRRGEASLGGGVERGVGRACLRALRGSLLGRGRGLLGATRLLGRACGNPAAGRAARRRHLRDGARSLRLSGRCRRGSRVYGGDAHLRTRPL